MKTDFMKSSICRALISLALGLILLIWPAFVAGSLVRIIGAIILIVGAMSIVRFFRDKDNMVLVGGIIEALAGLFLLFWPSAVLKIVFAVLALVIVVFAVDHIIRLAKANRRWPLYILPVAMIVMGVVIFFQPVDAAKLVVILFGVALVAYSISELVTMYFSKKTEETTVPGEKTEDEPVDEK